MTTFCFSLYSSVLFYDSSPLFVFSLTNFGSRLLQSKFYYRGKWVFGEANYQLGRLLTFLFVHSSSRGPRSNTPQIDLKLWFFPLLFAYVPCTSNYTGWVRLNVLSNALPPPPFSCQSTSHLDLLIHIQTTQLLILSNGRHIFKDSNASTP
jgi:hypothetical protein